MIKSYTLLICINLVKACLIVKITKNIAENKVVGQLYKV